MPAKGIFSGNQLKIFALFVMTCDHVGKFLFPHTIWLQMLGRFAYPIFAYMIAEGCIHTKKRKTYLGRIALVALLCQVVYLVAMQSIYQCIMVTFALSVSLIYVIDYAKEKPNTTRLVVALLALSGVFILTEIVPVIFSGSGFYVDYGFFGVLLPVWVYYAKSKKQKLCVMTVALILIAMHSGSIQWISLGTVPLVALYNGTRGQWGLKYLFYVYYPAHLVVIYLLGLWI